MGKAKMIGHFRPYSPNAKLDARYRRKMEAARHLNDKNNNGGKVNEAKQGKT